MEPPPLEEEAPAAAAASFSLLPNEILQKIFVHIPLQARLPLRQVNQRWKASIEVLCKRPTCLKIFGKIEDLVDYYRQLSSVEEYDLPYWSLKPIADGDDDDLIIGPEHFNEATFQILAELFPAVQTLIVHFLDRVQLKTLSRLTREDVNRRVFDNPFGRRFGGGGNLMMYSLENSEDENEVVDVDQDEDQDEDQDDEEINEIGKEKNPKEDAAEEEMNLEQFEISESESEESEDDDDDYSHSAYYEHLHQLLKAFQNQLVSLSLGGVYTTISIGDTPGLFLHTYATDTLAILLEINLMPHLRRLDLLVYNLLVPFTRQTDLSRHLDRILPQLEHFALLERKLPADICPYSVITKPYHAKTRIAEAFSHLGGGCATVRYARQRAGDVAPPNFSLRASIDGNEELLGGVRRLQIGEILGKMPIVKTIEQLRGLESLFIDMNYITFTSIPEILAVQAEETDDEAEEEDDEDDEILDDDDDEINLGPVNATHETFPLSSFLGYFTRPTVHTELRLTSLNDSYLKPPPAPPLPATTSTNHHSVTKLIIDRLHLDGDPPDMEALCVALAGWFPRLQSISLYCDQEEVAEGLPRLLAHHFPRLVSHDIQYCRYVTYFNDDLSYQESFRLSEPLLERCLGRHVEVVKKKLVKLHEV